MDTAVALMQMVDDLETEIGYAACSSTVESLKSVQRVMRTALLNAGWRQDTDGEWFNDSRS
jgi:hypothetical protein